MLLACREKKKYLCPVKMYGKMKKSILKTACGLLLGIGLVVASCRPASEVAYVGGGRVAMDSTWDVAPDADAVALLAPYKAQIDSVMGKRLGTAAMDMDCERPESLLSNLVADVLRESASGVLGHPADVAVMNIGGIRSSLAKGDITVKDVYEILPFENALCVLTLKGDVLRQLFVEMAARGGEGLSGARLKITADGKLSEATVAGKPVDDGRTYTVATIDYLAEGNDGMPSLARAEEKTFPADMVLRDVFMRYVERQTAARRAVTSRLDGRISVVKTISLIDVKE